MSCRNKSFFIYICNLFGYGFGDLNVKIIFFVVALLVETCVIGLLDLEFLEKCEFNSRE